MKKLSSFLLIALLLFTTTSCNNDSISQGGSQMINPENELYSDLHDDYFNIQSRIYDLENIILEDSDYNKAEKNKDLKDMKRFVFMQEPVTAGTGFSFVLDKRSVRIYSGGCNDIGDVLGSELIVDLQQSDIDKLIMQINKASVQKWPTKSLGLWSTWSLGIEYEDGSIEKHFGPGKPSGFESLVEYLVAESETFKERMLQDRKTTVNIDYLLSKCGWDPTWDTAITSPINLKNIDRIVIFEAEGPHEILDHSRNKQKTLFLNLYNNEMYYEPEKTVYEVITKAKEKTSFSNEYLHSVLSLLEEYAVTNWNANDLYLSSEEGLQLYEQDIPAWCIAIQFSDGRIARFSGDGIGKSGAPKGCYELLEKLFVLPRNN